MLSFKKVISAGLVVSLGLFVACDDESGSSASDADAAETNDETQFSERPSLTEMEVEGDDRLLSGLEVVEDDPALESLGGHAVRHLGKARRSEPTELQAPVGPSVLPAEDMTRDELARAFQAVSLVDGEVYRSAEPDYALADAILQLRASGAIEDLTKDALALQGSPESAILEKHLVDNTDARFRVTTTQDNYWRRIAFYGGPFTCTGFMIGPRTALTAAHCVWDRSANTWIHGNTVFNPGNDYNNAGPWSQVWNEGDYYPTIAQAWIDVGGVEWDLAIINFNNDVGNGSGWWGIDTAPSLNNSWIGNGGYPGGPPNGLWGSMYASWEYHTSSAQRVSLSSNIVRFANDTTGGHSGGPVFNWNTDRVFGIFTNHGTSASEWNWGCRINSSWLSMIDSWSEYTPQFSWGSNSYRP